ncbi:hypothetical protein [Amycolatopsis regifaucium]|uniref:DUF3558 domain-containing protein n=1 Tax=Amycolatopsis regifaucium TaxID=546365 RepID=A0A154MKE4_9PSEU|nr:hypothetical protein [Amycolatopsis regifaucium]KZB84493.1 hypothetical protein AVL48_32395 [Amycolatopsis regifaucium]OKA10955.1 hypothetical protein ATP06_0202060 [Amycolatopsis regifaucium]SFI23384.1 hypothetical protein SAMN04489731_109157 [Amycolatopsis regifaucium]
MGRSTAFAALTTAVLMVTGCASATPPAPVSSAPPPTGPLTLREALGDPTTVDFCGLLDFAEIEKTAQPLAEPTLSMGACSFRTTIAGSEALISFGFPDDRAKERLAAATPVTEPSLPRGLRMVRSDLQGQPLLHLIFTDDSSLRVGTFSQGREAAGPELLAVATKTMEGVVTALAAGKRATHLEYRDRSLARLDACSALVSDDEVSARLGVTVAGRGDLSRHQCLWGEQNAERIVRLEFGLGPHPKATAGVAGETVGGRGSFVQEVSGGCTVLTGHIGGPDPNRNQVEHAILAVQAPDACVVARRLAAIAWPKLPA